mgnify:FL=1
MNITRNTKYVNFLLIMVENYNTSVQLQKKLTKKSLIVFLKKRTKHSRKKLSFKFYNIFKQ